MFGVFLEPAFSDGTSYCSPIPKEATLKCFGLSRYIGTSEHFCTDCIERISKHG